MSHIHSVKARRWLLALTLVPCLALAVPAVAEEEAVEEQTEPTFEEAITKGDFSLFFNYRLESVSDDAFDKDALASTLRTAFAFKSLTWKHSTLRLEFENVTDIATDEQYNNRGAGDLWNGVDDRPVIADPEITEVNQAYVRFDLGDRTDLDIGRREIVLDNARWVGNVGWRQNHQSFDTATLFAQPIDHFKIHYSYVGNTNRIFGDNKPMNTHLINLGYTFDFPASLIGYGYILDYDREGDWGSSTSTYGIRFAGAAETGESSKLRFEAEWANQTDYGDNPNSIDADYYKTLLGFQIDAWTFDGAYEVLGAGQGRVSTPLATLHAHNGWADKFLGTPADGLVDLFLSVNWAKNSWGAKAIYHDFSSDQGSIDYGTEIDLQLTKKLPCGAMLGLKGALYSADEFSTDTEKFWFWLAKKFG
jgi:hypothetical protein